MTDNIEIIKRITEINEMISRLEVLKVDLQKLQEKLETPPIDNGEQLYIEYRNGIPVRFAYGGIRESTALWIDGVGYDTPEDAINAWKMKGGR